MSGAGAPTHLQERLIKQVLLTLFYAHREIPVSTLLRATLAPLPDIQESLRLLENRGCEIGRWREGIALARTGVGCWQDVLTDVAATNKLRIGQRILVFNRTSSTNDIAWQCATGDSADGLVVLADEQTAGRGRLGHQWMAAAGQSVLMSVLLKIEDRATIDALTLLAGLATARMVERFGFEEEVVIKWPNDVLIRDRRGVKRKVAGILVERRGDFVVVGIGVNVHQSAADFPEELRSRATSLGESIKESAGVDNQPIVDRARVIAELLKFLDDVLHQLRDESTWIAAWKSRCTMIGEGVTAQVGDQRLSGTIVDIDPLRGLVVRDSLGSLQFWSAATTTLAKA